MLNNFFKNINTLQIVLLLLAFLMPMVICDGAFADPGSSDDIDPTGIITIFCNVINQITNGIGKVIAILILISMAIGLFLGKITWGLAIAVMTGMGLLFGASGAVDLMAKTKDGGSDTTDICSKVGKAK